MTTLRERLYEAFKTILPDDPNKAKWGTELVEELRRAGFEDPENSLRQTFSAMAADPTSNIAKVAQGHGYYQRRDASQEVEETTNINIPETGRAIQREEKFRSLYMRWISVERFFPMHLDHTRAQRQQAGINK